MDAYPHAKLILTVRDEDAWLSSMNSTLFTAPKSTLFSRFADYHFGSCEGRGDEEKRRGYREHNENVKKWAQERARALLVYQVKEGWGPLCAFLGKEVPGVDFPRSDDWATKGWKKVVEHQTQK
jgi:Sulfotransferase domain